LKSNNQEERYLQGLDEKLERVVHASARYELTSGILITSSEMLFRLGFPATILQQFHIGLHMVI
jgi:ATP-binding cassette subfamily B protein